MNISTGVQLKVFIGGVMLGMASLSYFILKPTDTVHDQTVAQAKVFGDYIAKNPQIVLANAVSENEAEKLPAVLTQVTPVAVSTPVSDTLSAEQNQLLKDTFKIWSKKGAVRDANWRSQVEGLIDMAEKTSSEEVLDYIRPQIIFGRYDMDEKNQVYSQVWIERYLRLEKRDFQKKQIQDLLLK